MRTDPISRLRHLLQTLSFCLVIASFRSMLRPDSSYAASLVYSVAIGTAIWVLIDFGRQRVDAASPHGWPRGWRGLALPAVAAPLGFVVGIAIGDACFGRSSWGAGQAQELLGSIFTTLLATLVICYFFYSRSRSKGLDRRARESRQEAAEARLKLLETQLEPHMLFNTLANLRVLVAADPVRAQAMLDRLIAYLRATLDGSRAAWHPLADEFARLDDYLALMAVRMGDRLAYRLQLAPELAGVPVPPLLLQPLVENAIRHGLEPQVAGGRIDVEASLQGREVVLSVSDTGGGIAGVAPAMRGFGTVQVEERLTSAWNDAASLQFEAVVPTGARVVIRFPLPSSP